jgi:parallel beta-helix repeat protein
MDGLLPWGWGMRGAVLAVALVVAPGRAAEYFVSATGGNDSGPGTFEAPWATLQRAANVVAAGDRVVVRPGTYAGFYLDHKDGQAAARIEFVAQPGVLIDMDNGRTEDGINLEGASYVTVDGFAVTGMGRAGVRSVLGEHVTVRNVHAYDNQTWGIFTGFVDHLLIENNETSGSIEEHGIYVSNSGDFPVLRNNYSWNNHGSGIHMNGDASEGGDGIISGALVAGNRIYSNAVSVGGGPLGGGSGINMDGVQNSRIENNLVYDNHASGISLYRIDGGGGSTGNVVVNNTVHQPSNGRWALNITDGSTGNTVLNNIFVTEHATRGSISVSADSLPGLVSNYNVLEAPLSADGGNPSTTMSFAQWQAAGRDLNSKLADAASLFVSPPTGDYSLKPGVVAIDAGTVTSAPSVDFFGTSRPQGAGVDAGAVERPSLVGDFNGDSQVNSADLGVWRNGFGAASGASAAQGDADGDRDVDGADFLAWQHGWGSSSIPASSVPESATPLLAWAVFIALARSRFDKQ